MQVLSLVNEDWGFFSGLSSSFIQNLLFSLYPLGYCRAAVERARRAREITRLSPNRYKNFNKVFMMFIGHLEFSEMY